MACFKDSATAWTVSRTAGGLMAWRGEAARLSIALVVALVLVDAPLATGDSTSGQSARMPAPGLFGAVAVAPPGEATQLRVVGYDPLTESMTLSYQPACGAAGHHIEYGPLASVAGHVYAGQVCGLDTSGSFGGFDPGGGSWFFLVVGDDAAGVEGSYGLVFEAGLFAERREDLADPACAFVRDLSQTCDLPAAPSVDITAHRPQTEAYGLPFARRAVPDAEESAPGVGIRVNGDDDDTNGVPDRDDAGSLQENDLIEVVLAVAPPLQYGVEVLLRRTSDSVRVWASAGKGESVLTAGDEVVLAFPSSSRTVFVENPAGGAADLELVARSVSGKVLLASEVVHFYPFTSTVIALGGESQAPADPPLDPNNHGTFQLAIDLYTRGYDVHMYDEDVVANGGAGAAYDEVVNAVTARGVTHVAIFGYSHGGGSTSDLAARLDTNRLAIGLFAIDFTAYMDGIENDSDFDLGTETTLPPSSGFHANYYENPGCSFFQLCGGPVAGADLNVNVSATPWGATLDHFSVDDAPEVLDGIRDDLLVRVPR